MKRHDLKNGMIVQTREDMLYVIIDNRMYPLDDAVISLEKYDSNLLFEFPFREESAENSLDIMKVYDNESNVIWEREITKSEIAVGDVFIDDNTGNMCYIKKAHSESDTYTILFNEDELTWEFEEDGDTIRDNYRKVFNVNEKAWNAYKLKEV